MGTNKATNKASKSFSHLLIQLFLISLLSLIGAVSEAAPVATKLGLNWKPEPQFGGFYAADIVGAFKKNGISVSIIPGGAGTPAVQMVAAGQLDFGIASADEVVIARARGADVVALFAVYQVNPQGIMVHEARGFKELSDVYKSEGRLSLQKGLPYAMFLSKKYAPVKVELVPYIGGIQNFLSDPLYSQQCFVTAEPLLAQKQGMKVKTFLVADAGYNPYTTVLITRSEFIRKNPALVKAMVNSVREGWSSYLKQPELSNRKMAELNKAMDLATFKSSADAQKGLIETEFTRKHGLGAMEEERWATLARQLVDLKLIPKAPDANSLFYQLEKL